MIREESTPTISLYKNRIHKSLMYIYSTRKGICRLYKTYILKYCHVKIKNILKFIVRGKKIHE